MTASAAALIRRGRRLQYLTIGYNCLEALVALGSGFLSGSIALVGFGFDSLIEVTSGGAVLWRLYRGERAERLALRMVGVCFILLAVYVAWEASEALLGRHAPERSLPGIALAAASIVVMPVLARAKRRVGMSLGSAAVQADARQTDFCFYLSVILLAGLVLNAGLGWWWADPAAGLAMTPLIAREGAGALRGKACCCDDDGVRCSGGETT
jgi:divalent metal cation (Fe/Co/Zn/Cd) transporter